MKEILGHLRAEKNLTRKREYSELLRKVEGDGKQEQDELKKINQQYILFHRLRSQQKKRLRKSWIWMDI